MKDREAKRAASLANMRKYLDLTDKSVDSRIRYAQFLVYANDYATLEKEVATLNVEASNPKSFLVTRLRGYSAVENKNFAAGVKYMNELFARKQDAARILGEDYLMLGRALEGTGNDSLAVLNISKAVDLDLTKVEELATLAKKYYTEKNYAKAIPIYKKVIKSNSKNPAIGMHYFQLGISSYVAGANAANREALVEADSSFSKLLSLLPETEQAMLYRARINKAIDGIDNKETPKGLAVPFYEKFITLVTVTKPEKAAPNSKNLVDSYNYLGFIASGTDKEKAKEYFNKALAIDPQNAYASDNLKVLNAPPAPAKKAPIK